MTTPAERKALNEGTFRDANEKLQEAALGTVAVPADSLVPFLCECPDEGCTQVVLVTPAEYERIRANPRGGIAAVGHEDETIERIIDRNDRFTTTEKFGEAGEVHTETDPRRDDERVRRIGENETLYREINERISEISQPLSTVTGVFQIACECGEIACAEELTSIM